ncbi:Permease of the drug/metabolite transporter (DMT) superfamily [Halomonas citrativorans]|uniref:Permease of the drug/metabolite transporter (DMT) superfamily n=3 Tax=Halomonas TaxID=2745 RepID=A0A1R4I5E1_9GAMM|nr:Permease of the drug/metabolite transporter (DMT) superfamily [Halomonas citrativorans]
MGHIFMGALLTPTRIKAIQHFTERLVERIKPWSWLWPPMAFSAGVGSFFLVDRQQWLGAALALGLLFTWALLLSESLIGRWLAKRGHPTLHRGATTFIAQMIHQETLFFTLPFILITTVWNSGQTLFALLVIGMSLLSIIDPLYYKVAGRWRSLYFIFHALCVFLVMLVTLPIMLHLTTGQSLFLAMSLMVLVALPSFWHLLKQRSLKRWCLFLGLALALAYAAWIGRIWVPPASLWLTSSALSPSLDIQQREPQGSIALTPDAIRQNGLYVYTAIRAPRGLSETIYHAWRHNGEPLDTVRLDISGGREQGYRAWSHKLNFPADPSGDWRVDIMTDSGQRLGLIRFTVSEDLQKASKADSAIRASGLSSLNLRRFVPGSRERSDTPTSD